MKEVEVNKKKKKASTPKKIDSSDTIPIASTSKLLPVIEVLENDVKIVEKLKLKESEMLVNYNEIGIPAADLTLYHELSCRQWIIGLVSTCLLASLFAYLRLSAAIPIAIIGMGCFLTRRSVESLKFDFVYKNNRAHLHPAVNVIEEKEESTREESVDWLNNIIGAVWPILDAEIFVAGVDLLEDSLKELAPSIVRTVRISSFSQGSTPIQLLSIRRLSPTEDIVIPSSYTSNQSSTSTSTKLPQPHPADPGPSIPVHLEEPGTYVNLEVEFVYKRLSGVISGAAKEGNAEGTDGKKDNTHFVVYLGVGVKKLVKLELPVWCELTGIAGKLRLRLQVIPEPPFVRHVKFCFPTQPIMEIRAKPLKSFNIMTLPLISTYILNSVNSVLNHFVSPETYTIDLSRFFLGSDVIMKTKAIGVISLVIHRAEKLGAGKINVVDPFVKISLAHVGKTLATTRVLSNERDPIWEEMFFLQVSNEDFEDSDKLRLTVLDYDPNTSNDVLGYVELPLHLLKDHAGQYEIQSDRLHSSVRGSPLLSSLFYRAAFFPLAKTIPTFSVMDHSHDLDPTTNNDLYRSSPYNSTSNLHAGTNSRRKPEKSRTTFAERSTIHDSPSGEYAARMREMLDGRLPPNPSQHSGILAFQVHQIAELEVDRSLVSTINHHFHGHHAKEKDLPSSYCNVFLNEEKVFSTRIKAFSSAPYFNVGSESFLRDWTTSRFDVVVMDSKESGEDVIVGFVSLQLNDLFALRSQVTRWFPLTTLNGAGRIRLSLLIKPVDIEITSQLREWNVGTLEITSARISDLKEQFKGKLMISVDNSLTISTADATSFISPVFDSRCLRRNEIEWTINDPLRVPTISRHSSPILFRLSPTDCITNDHEISIALLWLSDVAGSTVSTHFLKVAVESTESNHSRPLESLPVPTLLPPIKRRHKPHDSLTSSPFHSPPHSPSLVKTLSIKEQKIIGTLEISVRWIRGIDESHRDLVVDPSSGAQDAFQLWNYRQLVALSPVMMEDEVIHETSVELQDNLEHVKTFSKNLQVGFGIDERLENVRSGVNSAQSSGRNSFEYSSGIRSYFSSPEEGVSEDDTAGKKSTKVAGSIRSKLIRRLKILKDMNSNHD